MNTKTREETILLREILARLDRLEQELHKPSDAGLTDKLKKLTIKRHAVLTATLGGLGYDQIADLMNCGVTTVKLHLKSVLSILGIGSRSILLSNHSDLLRDYADREYVKLFGLSKTWWMTQKPELMSVLRAVKPTLNQHTLSAAPKKRVGSKR